MKTAEMTRSHDPGLGAKYVPISSGDGTHCRRCVPEHSERHKPLRTNERASERATKHMIDQVSEHCTLSPWHNSYSQGCLLP